MAKNSAKYQYYATVCVNILSMSYGAFCGWPSSSFLILQSNESPLEGGPMTDEQASWVGSFLCIGGFFGNFLFGWLANQLGRKISIILLVVPSIVSLLLIILATNVNYLIASRFIGGLAGGGIFCIVPLYITEISEDRIRGHLGSYLVFSCSIGILIAFILGCYVQYEIFPYTLLIFPILFLVLFVFLPETPPHLLKTKKIKEAEKSLRYFRNLGKISKEPPEYFKYELEKLKHDYLDDSKKTKEDEVQLSWSDFTTKPAIKSFVIGFALMALNQFCGCFAMINYTSTIFVKAGSTLSPNVSSIIVAVIQLIGSYFSVILVERAGRKLLISGSAFGNGLGLLCMGSFILIDSLPGYDVSGYRWVPLASFSFTIFIVSWGASTLSFLLLSELCPPRIREVVVSVCVSLLWILAFLILKYLSVVVDAWGLHGALFIFAASSFAGGIFLLAFVPETKGKSSDEIMAMLE